MVDTESKPVRHDAETFRVAEELIMLSSRAPLDGEPNDSPSNISGFFEHTTTEKREPKVKVKTRGQRNHRTSRSAKQSKTKTKVDEFRGAAHKSSDRDEEFAGVASDQTAEDIVNSRCDLSHSELLKEHRVRFRRVRRRWHSAQRSKNQEYLARFHVQGIPLVQHLETLTHWR